MIAAQSKAQEDILTIVDSLYESKDYQKLIQQSEAYLLDENPNPYEITFLKYYLGNSYYKSGDFINGWQLMQDSHKSITQLNVDDTTHVELYIDVSQRLGDFSFQAEEYKIGLDALSQAIEMAKEKIPNDAWRLGKLYHKAGAIYRITTQFDQSIAHLEEGLMYIPKMPKAKGDYISTVFLAEQAQVYNDKNQLNKSIEIFKTILKQAYEEDNKKRLSIYNNNIAIAYERKADYGKSEYHLKKSLEAKLELYGEKTPKIISNYSNLGRINSLLKRHKIADQYYSRLNELLAEVFEKDHVKNGEVQYNIGSSYYEQKLYEKALPYFLETVRIYGLHKNNEDLNMLEAQQMLGATYTKLNIHNKAIPLLTNALKVRSKVIKTQDQERKIILTALYESHLAQGQEKKATSFLEQAYRAINFDKANPYAFEQIENPIELIDPLALNLSSIASQIETTNSTELIQEGLFISSICDSLIQHIKLKYDDVSSRRIATSKIQDLNEAIIQFNYTAHTQSERDEFVINAFRIIERSNNNFLYEAIAEEDSNEKFKIPLDILNRKTQLQDSITLLSNALESIPIDARTQSPQYAEYLAELNTCKSDLYAILNMIETEHPNYYESIYKEPEVTLKTVQSSLLKNEIIISYFNGFEKVYGLLISSKGHQFIVLGESRSISKSITDFMDSLKGRSYSTPYLNASKELHKRLISPFEIPENAAISIIADDMLSLVPFEILIDEYSNLPMLISHVITYQYSNSLAFSSMSNSTGTGALSMAPVFENNSEGLIAQNILAQDVFRSEFGALPESKNEVNAIHNLVKGEVSLGIDASESEFKSKAPNKALLHLATHGYVDHENPDFSRLYFNSNTDSEEDGLLYAYEIVNMDLSADLVTLSACNTGSGQIQNGEGISSLGRAFAYANCPNQLISLWPANDKSTTQLMTYYYKNLIKGKGKSDALTEAKREYLSNAPDLYKHPYYWAGFVYYGQNTPLDLGGNFSSWKILGIIVFFILLIYLFKERFPHLIRKTKE